jgi:N-acetylglucosaminyldiphosphoundecaprenol N-acetyl-beta-D-mannosaminyltransferase
VTTAAARGQIARYTLGGISICATDLRAAVELIIGAGLRDRPLKFHFSSAKDIVQGASDPSFTRILNEADFVLPDGVPLVWFGRLRGHEAARVCGPDAMLAVLEHGRDRGARHFFYGGGPGVAARLAAVLTRRMPDLRVAGYETPPFRPLTSAESAATIRRINATRPTHVWVGISSPKQDFWIANHAEALHCGAVLGVGAAFDFHSGTRRRAPRWMQKSGTEWFFRLLSEPRRLARRYTVTNSQFLAIVARELLSAPKPTSSRESGAEPPNVGGTVWQRTPEVPRELSATSDPRSDIATE